MIAHTPRAIGPLLPVAIVRLEHLPRIFDLFYTTKPLGLSTGLGLSICHRLVTEMGGELRCDSVTGEGATFTVHLPTSRKPETGSGS